MSSTHFTDIVELKDWHRARVAAAATRIGTKEAVIKALQSDIEAVRATGASLSSDSDRRSAQSILDYWAAELISIAPADMQIRSPPQLASAANVRPDPEIVDGLQPDMQYQSPPQLALVANVRPDPEIVDGLQLPDLALLRERIRLAASARLWRDSGKKPGYLLFGKALSDASRVRDDPDITDLVTASMQAAQAVADTRRRRIVSVLLGSLMALIVATGTFAFLWRKSDRALEEVRAAKEVADTEARLRSDEEATGRQLRLEEQSRTASALDDARGRLAELQSSGRQLDAALGFIRSELDLGRVQRSRIPPSLLALVDALAAANPGIVTPPSDAAGYNSDFLGTPLPPPSATASSATTPLLYPNYSVVLASARRMALFTASNVDRQKLRVLPRAADVFSPDPRWPVDQQPDPGWFGGDVRPGTLVTRQEVAWGELVQGEEGKASILVTGLTNLYPNVTPQFDTLALGVWEQLERWAITDHNRRAARVSIFSGPVLRDDDPIVRGVKMPARFWKIIVSRNVNDGPRLIVDAFLIPQFQEGTADKALLGDFQAGLYRVDLSDIEEATGLSFGTAIRNSDRVVRRTSPELSSADNLDARVRLLGAQTPDQRGATVQQLVAAFGKLELPDADQRALVAALANVAGDNGGLGLSRAGQLNLLSVLTEVPRQNWDRADWIDVRASVRKAVVGLEARGNGNDASLGSEMNQAISGLKDRLGWNEPRNRTVSMQFAGKTREQVVALSTELKALGWQIPSEERASKAAKLNEVRYGDPADAQAAALLAADLRARGLDSVGPPVVSRDLRLGALEIWISR